MKVGNKCHVVQSKLSGACKYYKLNNEGDRLLCPNVDSLCMKGAPQSGSPGLTRAADLGRTHLYRIKSVLWRRGLAAFPGVPGRESRAYLPCPPAALSPIPALLNLLFPVHTHSMALCLVWSGPRPESCSLQVRGQRQEQGLCPPHVPSPAPPAHSRPASLSAHLTVYQSKHSDPRGLAAVKATCPSAPTPKPNPVSSQKPGRAWVEI